MSGGGTINRLMPPSCANATLSTHVWVTYVVGSPPRRSRGTHDIQELCNSNAGIALSTDVIVLAYQEC